MEGEMITLDWQLIAIAVHVIILFFVLRWLLYNPVSEMMANRTREIEEGLRMAEENRKRQEELNAEYEQKIQEARQEARQIVDKAYTQRDELLKEAQKEANQKAEEMLEKARQEIEAEKNRAFSEMRQEIASFSVAIASRIMEKEIDEASQEKLIERYLEEVGRAS